MVKEVIAKVKEGVKDTINNVNSKVNQMLPNSTSPNAPQSSWFQNFYEKYKTYIWLSAASIGFQSLLFLIKKWKQRIRNNTILELDLDDVVLDDKPTSPALLAALQGEQNKKIHFKKLLETLESATVDTKVKGLIVRCGNCTSTNAFLLGHIQELREAIQAFRAAGKKAIVHSESLGLFSNAVSSYYFMTVFDEIHVSPIGSVYLTGLLASGTFFKSMLDKIGAEAHVQQREEYKTFANMINQEKFTEPHKEQVQTLVNDILAQVKNDIATDRKVAVETVDSWMNKAIFTCKSALENKVIDKITHRDEALEALIKLVGLSDLKQASLLFANVYHERTKSRRTGGKYKVAVVYLRGGIMDGEQNSLGGDDNIYSFTAARAIRLARKDKTVKAIILRIDSGGGSAVASEVIAREIELAKKDGKKIVASMANVAASGGYWIAAPADKIVCNKLAFTGSIGVVSAKFNVRETMKKIGITFDFLPSHDNSTVLSQLHGYNEEENKAVNSIIDFFYDLFLEKVAACRKLDISTVRSLAKGQVYVGAKAKELKLVDEVGGFKKTIEVTKELLGLKAEDKIQLVEFPARKGALAMLLSQATPAENSDDKDKKTVAAFMPSTNWMSVVASQISQSDFMKGLLPILQTTNAMQNSTGVFFYSQIPSMK